MGKLARVVGITVDGDPLLADSEVTYRADAFGLAKSMAQKGELSNGTYLPVPINDDVDLLFTPIASYEGFSIFIKTLLDVLTALVGCGEYTVVEVLMSNNLSEVQVLCDEDDLGTATRIPHPSLHNCYDIGPADNGFRISPFIRDELLAQNEELYTRSLGFYHPSALASNNCDRALAYERLAVVPRPIFNEWDFRYFALGHAIHGIIQTLVKKRLGDAVEVEPRISVPALHIDGAADIIYRNKFVTDIKTVSAAELEKLEVARKKDALQMQPYFIARDIPNGSILYVSRENMKRKEIPVQFNRKMVTKITERIGSIETTLAAGGLPAREGNAGDCASCKYQFICKPADSSY